MSAGSGCDKTCQEVLTRFVQHHDGRATAVDETKWPCNNVASGVADRLEARGVADSIRKLAHHISAESTMIESNSGRQAVVAS
jgi:hypothetical protein